MKSQLLIALALADFRERVRRPAYTMVLLVTVGLAYLAVPASGSRWVIFDAGTYRGVYNSAYVGTAVALAGALWLLLGGFYVVRGTIARDERTGVGQVLAATPMSSVGYFAGKYLSNLLVLASMSGVLAVAALVMQLARGESSTFQPLSLLWPFVLLLLPVLAATAAAALLFDGVRPLRSGLGNIAWFFFWTVAAVAGQGANAPLGGFGVQQVARSMHRALIAQHLRVHRGEFSLGLMYLDSPLHRFVWSGLGLDAGFVASRAAGLALASAVALIPALWFARFDPSRTLRPAMAKPARRPPRQEEAPPPAPQISACPSRPRSPVHQGLGLPRLLAGELRTLIQGVSAWWWVGVGGLTLAGLAVPQGKVPGVLLLDWIWPILVWSRLGTQWSENGLEGLLGAYPSRYRRLLAEWMAGLSLAALVGCVPMLRMVGAGNWSGVQAWAGGALLIPSLALALGTVTRTQRVFQVLYVALWYAIANGVAGVDFLGAVTVHGRPAGVPPFVTGGIALAMLAGAFLTSAARHARR